MTKISEEKLREMSTDARAFLHSDACDYILTKMRDAYIQELVRTEVGSLTAASAHASMKVLETFKAQLQSLTNEEAFLNRSRTR